MSSAYTQVADLLKTIIDTEFAPEGFVAIKDNLHESLGRNRVEIGISPMEDNLQANDDIVQDSTVEVKFYGLWKQEITPATLVDPTPITDYAERFRKAVGRFSGNYAGTPEVWYFDIRRITYPNDPTGNKSRFVATVRAKGNNSGLVETI